MFDAALVDSYKTIDKNELMIRRAFKIDVNDEVRILNIT